MNARIRQQRDPRLLSWLAIAIGFACVAASANGQDLPGFDFTKSPDAQGWQPTHDVARVQATSDGLEIEISGNDPYLHGPPRDYPAEQPLWMHIRLKSSQSGIGQVFYFGAQHAANETDSVRFAVRGGQWEDLRVPLPLLGKAYRLRLDPPGGPGNRATLASLMIEPRTAPKAPPRPMPTPADRRIGGARHRGARRIRAARRIQRDAALTAHAGGQGVVAGRAADGTGDVHDEHARLTADSPKDRVAPCTRASNGCRSPSRTTAASSRSCAASARRACR